MAKQLLKERFQELAGIKSLNEFKEGEDFGFWFRAGVRAEKQIQQAKDLLTQNGIEFNTEGRFAIDFQGKGYEKGEIVQLLRDNGLTRFVIYDYEGSVNTIK